jgi:hypothetical protein
MPFVPFTRFYNTLVAGGLAGGIILWIPVFVLFMILIPLYRNSLGPKIRGAKFFKTIAKIPFLSSITRAVSEMTDKGA